MLYDAEVIRAIYVAPYAGAWIEIPQKSAYIRYPYVAPYAGAWIEIISNLEMRCKGSSLPTRERGLKYGVKKEGFVVVDVAPYAGAWIEIKFISRYVYQPPTSLPTRERGLKS